MNQSHQGWDYRLYKIYIWGGLALIVAHVLVSTLALEALSLPGSQAFLLIAGPMLVWFAGIVLYWWWVFLFKGNQELEELSLAQGQGVPGIHALRSWSTLHQAMAIHGGKVEELIKNEKKAKRPVLLWYGGINLLVVWIIGPFILGYLGIIETGGLGIWLAGVLVWIVLMVVGTPVLLSWGGKSMEKAYLAPLGLAVTRTPRLQVDVIGLTHGGQRLIPEGPAMFEGERHGCLVHIEAMGEHSLTILQAGMPTFEVKSNDGKLVPDKKAPEAIVGALGSLRKAKRWRGVVVSAGPEGMAVQRQSKGTNMWLYDLWLAEYLLDRVHANGVGN